MFSSAFPDKGLPTQNPPQWRGILARWASLPEQTQREQQFQNWLYNHLSRYFHLKREAEGRTVRGEIRRIDFLCIPRSNVRIVAEPRLWRKDLIFGIEAKYPLGWDDDSPLPKWIRQMEEYCNCRFKDKKGEFTLIPSFVISCPPLSTLLNDQQLRQWTMRINQQIRLGELNLRSKRDYDPPQDILDMDYEFVFEIAFNHGTVFWRNSNRRLGGHPGKHILG